MVRAIVAIAGSAVLLSAWPASLPGPTAMAARRRAEAKRETRVVVRMNRLAGHLHSVKDAQKLLKMLAKQYASALPPSGIPPTLLHRLAVAEYGSTASPKDLISDKRIADAWNAYMQQIGAPQDTHVTAAYVHGLRMTYARMAWPSWNYGYRTTWTMPAIYATKPDGTLRHGATVLEVARLIEGLSNNPPIRAACDRVRMKQMAIMGPGPKAPRDPEAERNMNRQERDAFDLNAVRDTANAQARYQRERGEAASLQALEGLMNRLLPAHSAG